MDQTPVRRDLNKLTERELLILVNYQVQQLEDKMQEQEEQIQTLMIKVNTIEAKAKVWGSITGLFTGLAAIIGERFLMR
jgi:DeoR/GlpR family transcriptional regulator of sugar metabolism